MENFNLETCFAQVKSDWKKKLSSEFSEDYMHKLNLFLNKEFEKKRVIYPTVENIFKALELTSLKDVKLVILGQDPYHGPNQAHGLSFSVPEEEKVPPSLRNIFKEIDSEYANGIPKHGNLKKWAKQGVLLLNASLTVEANKAGSHQKKGWEEFTDAIIACLNLNKQNVVYMLWGAYAQKKGSIIDSKKNLILKSAHPSPLSAHRGFLGNNHFSQANKYLSDHGLKPIDWNIK